MIRSAKILRKGNDPVSLLLKSEIFLVKGTKKKRKKKLEGKAN